MVFKKKLPKNIIYRLRLYKFSATSLKNKSRTFRKKIFTSFSFQSTTAEYFEPTSLHRRVRHKCSTKFQNISIYKRQITKSPPKPHRPRGIGNQVRTLNKGPIDTFHNLYSLSTYPPAPFFRSYTT